MPVSVRVAESPPRLGPSSEVAPPMRAVDTAADDPSAESSVTHQHLLTRVADALRANLARGFLESEDRLRQMAEAMSDVVLLGDEASEKVFFVNAAYEQIWGRSRADLYANPSALLEGVHPADRDHVRAARSGRPGEGHDIEFRVQQPSGDERWVWSRGFPIRVEGGVDRVASIIADITERKQIVKSHELLIRGFTHDMKNPLGAADGYLAMLEMGVYGPMSDTQIQSVGHARRSIQTALHLVSGLLEIERAEAGRLNIVREGVDLGAMVVEMTEEFSGAAEAKSIRLTSVIPQDGDALHVVSDAARVRQILANLVSNAVKYTQAHGHVSVEAHVALVGGASRPGRWATVVVTDDGPGIPVEKHRLVFREFTRFDPGASSGSGIGLAISRRVAHALGGEITFASTPGVNTTFTLWLPLDVAVPAGP